MLDLHCHLLPGVDDGAADLDEATAMARLLLQLGFTGVAASPHHGLGPGGDVPRALADCQRSRLTARLEEEGVPLRVLPNAEHHVTVELFDRLAQDQVETIGGRGRWLLTELPWQGLADVEGVLFRLQAKGLRLLLAHPERYDNLPIDLLRRLCDRGMRLQLELGSFVGYPDAAVEARARALLDQELAHVVATDLHKPDCAAEWLRAALGALGKRIGGDGLTLLLETNPERIVADAGPDELLAWR
jgi:protein-tyrosine phosphatase